MRPQHSEFFLSCENTTIRGEEILRRLMKCMQAEFSMTEVGEIGLNLMYEYPREPQEQHNGN
jgi:hypothetical protein